MAVKSKIRSIRFSEEMCDIIERQVGDNFNKKFETLVYNCYMVLPQKEQEIQRLDKLIAEKRKELGRLSEVYLKHNSVAQDLVYRLKAVSATLETLEKE